MKTGTKSLLFGYHQVFLHPLFVAAGWRKLYGFPWDPRLWVAFIVHDWGYWGCPEMDGPVGTQHPWTGARIMGHLFDTLAFDGPWYCFALFHSRTICKGYGGQLSRLGYADKLAFLLYPEWLLKALAGFSGEAREYFADAGMNTWAEWYAMACDKNRVTVTNPASRN